MNWIEVTPIDLYKIKEILESSKNYIRSHNINDIQLFCEELIMQELPGQGHFYCLENDSEILGFVLYSSYFPLAGFTNLHQIVFKDEFCQMGFGSEVINKLKKESTTLWIDQPSEEDCLAFWISKKKREEAGRWIL